LGSWVSRHPTSDALDDAEDQGEVPDRGEHARVLGPGRGPPERGEEQDVEGGGAAECQVAARGAHCGGEERLEHTAR